MLNLSLRYFVLSLILHILCQTAQGQQISLFSKYTPSLFDSVQYNPDSFAIGDVNGDGFEDLVIRQSNRNPFVFYFAKHSETKENPEGIGEWDFASDSLKNDPNFTGIPRDTIQLQVTSVGPIHIMDGKNIGKNEIYFHHNVFQRATNAFVFTNESGSWGTDFIATSNPSGYQYSAFSSMSWAYGDYNSDGLLDAIQGLFTTKTANNILIYNVFTQNNRPFTRITDSDVVLNYGRTLGLYSYDFNNDGYTDVWEISSEAPTFTNLPDFLYVGDGTNLIWNSSSVLSSQSTSNGAAIGDYDNDGDLDIYQVMSGGQRANMLYQNNGNFSFERIENTLTRDQLDSREAMWGDFNNDGFLDLIVSEYNGSDNRGAYPNLFINNGRNSDGVFTFSKRIFGGLSEIHSLGNWNHVAFVDFDLDGDLDVFLTGKQLTQPIQIFRNHLMQESSIALPNKFWIGFDLEATNSFTKLAINAKVTVTATINGRQETIYRELQPFHGNQAQQTKLLHFGLGNATSAQVNIIWPSGLKQQQFYALNTLNQYHKIVEPTASRLSVSSAQPYSIVANLEEPQTDTLYFENIGGANLSITSVQASKTYYTVKDYTRVVAPGDSGFVVIQTLSTNSALIGNHRDTLTVRSNNLSGARFLLLETEFKSRPARFSIVSEHTLKASFLSYVDTYQNVIAGNFNSDEQTDLYMQRLEASSLLFARDDSTFTFLDTALPSLTGSSSKHVATADINHDGIHDILVVNEGQSNQLFVSGTGGYALHSVPAFSTPRLSRFGVFHDIDKNGQLDMLIANTSNQANQLILGNRNRTFVSHSAAGDEFTTTLGFTSFITVHDVDGDGLDDILTTEQGNPSGNKIHYYRQVEPLVFKRTDLKNVTDVTFTAKGILFFDKENDGDFDLLLVSALPGTASKLLENTDGNYSVVNQTRFEAIKGSVGDVLLTDFNMDGYLDIFFTETDFSKTNKLLQSAGGVDYFSINSGQLVQEAAKSTIGAITYDYNNDAKPDFFITNYFGTAELYRNEIEENNRVGIIPLSDYANGKQSVRPGTLVELRAHVFGKNMIMSRVAGRQSLHSGTLQALWFGLGDATSADYRIIIPGLEKVITGRLSVINDYEIITIMEVSNEQNDWNELPKTLSVSDAFPNPFNPSTRIQLALPISSTIEIRVFDVVGRQIQAQTLSRTAGHHVLELNLTQQSSGVYLIQVIVQEQQFLKKVLLLK